MVPLAIYIIIALCVAVTFTLYMHRDAIYVDSSDIVASIVLGFFWPITMPLFAIYLVIQYIAQIFVRR